MQYIMVILYQMVSQNPLPTPEGKNHICDALDLSKCFKQIKKIVLNLNLNFDINPDSIISISISIIINIREAGKKSSSNNGQAPMELNSHRNFF